MLRVECAIDNKDRILKVSTGNRVSQVRQKNALDSLQPYNSLS